MRNDIVYNFVKLTGNGYKRRCRNKNLYVTWYHKYACLPTLPKTKNNLSEHKVSSRMTQQDNNMFCNIYIVSFFPENYTSIAST